MRTEQIVNSIPNWFWMLILFGVALCIRLLHLTDTDIAGDEPFSIFVAQFEPTFIIEYLSKGNNPPLFELTLHYWMDWVGDSDYKLRMLPAIFGALTVVPIFLIGARFFSRDIGILASLLFIFSTWNIRFAHEVRVYSLLTLLVSLSVWFFLSVIKSPNTNRNWVGLAVIWVLMLYSHYVSVYMVGAQVLIGAFCIPKAHFKRAFGLVLILTLAYIPNIFVFIQRVDEVVDGGGTWVKPPGWGEIYGSVNLMLNNRLVTVILLLVLVAGVLLAKPPRLMKLSEVKQPKMAMTIILLFAIPYTSQFFVSKWFLPMFIDRYILYASVPFYLSVAWVVNHVWKNSMLLFVGPLTLVASVIIFGTSNPTNNREVSDAVQKVKQWNTEDAIIYVLPEEFELTFAYHFDRDWFRQLGTMEVSKSKIQKAMNSNRVYAISSSKQLINQEQQRVICIDAHSEFLHPNNGILKSVKSNYSLKDSIHFHQIFDVYLFERN